MDFGQALQNYARYRAAHSRLGQAIGLKPPQQNSPVPTPARIGDPQGQIGDMDHQMAAQPQQPDDSGAVNDWGSEAMASGKMVTQPTVALIGEKGPEAVVPLTNQPGAKVGSGMLGQGGMKTRYRRPSGPNAISHQAPVRSDLPLKPNSAPR